MLQLTLRRMGVETAPAEDGTLAVDAVRAARDAAASLPGSEPFLGLELITMDFSMPRLNGPDATRLIRTDGFDGLVIGCTGNALAHDVEHFKRCGADAVLAKPIDTGRLYRLLAARFPGRVLRPPGLPTREDEDEDED